MLIRFRRNKKDCSRLVNSCTQQQSKLYFRKQDVSVNKRYRIPKGQSKTDNRENMATQGTQDEEKHRETGNIGYTRRRKKPHKDTIQYNMCWTPLYTNKHK